MNDGVLQQGSFIVRTGPALPEHSLHKMQQAANSDDRSAFRRLFCCFKHSPPPVYSHFNTGTTMIFHSEPPPAIPEDAEVDVSENLDLLEPLGVSMRSQTAAVVTATNQFDDSMYFFDAVESHGDLESMLDLYPIVTTTTVPPKKFVSLDAPQSMLGHDSDGHIFQDAMSYRNLLIQQSKRRLSISDRSNKSNDNVILQHIPPGASAKGTTTTPAAEMGPPMSPNTKRRGLMHRFSSRFLTSTRQMEQLHQPRILIQERGFPGSLSPDELEACQALVRELRNRHDLAEIVYSLRHIEDAPYALCRFLRATKFQVPALMERLEKHAPDFAMAKADDFYPNLQDVMTNNTPLFAFFSCYPFLTSGRAKNGCPVNYFAVGRIQAQALFSMVTFDAFKKFMWHQSYHAFSRNMKISMVENPNVVRMESVTVLDLAGLTYASASSSEAMEAVQLASHIGDYFPETLHCMIILNAPAYFAAVWSLIKQMIDPRTAKRIQVFSSAAKGTARLREMVADDQIPSDYGGNGPSLHTIMEDLAHGAHPENNSAEEVQSSSSITKKKLKRTTVEAIQLKRKATKEHRIELKGGEVMTLRVFTRSATPAKVSLHGLETSARHTHHNDAKKALFEGTLQGGPPPRDNNNSDDDWENHPPPKQSKDTAVPHPIGTTIGTRMFGPGTFVVKLQDLGESAPSGAPTGMFVIVGEVA